MEKTLVISSMRSELQEEQSKPYQDEKRNSLEEGRKRKLTSNGRK